MISAKKLAVGSAVLGASLGSVHGFVAPGAPSEGGAQSSLRVVAHAQELPTSSNYDAHPTLVVAATGVAASFAVLAGRKVGNRKRAANIARNFNKETELGAQAPLGFFDPLNFCENEEKFKDLRAKELKHGRLAMMGALGMLTQSVVQVPGMEGVPKGITAGLVGNGQVGLIATLAIIAVLETTVFVQDPQKEPGNFGNPLPWFDDYSMEMRARELNNGRIAMFSAVGIIAAGAYTGKPAIEQFGV